MSFFRRDEEPAATPGNRPAAPSPPAARSEQKVTRIAAGTRITGEISGTTELHVDGEIDGRIRLDARVVIGESGGVLGEIEGRSVAIAGRVEGPVRGADRVEVTGNGRLEGNIAAPRVTIAEGAFFKGRVEMGGEGERRDAKRSTSPSGGGGRGESPTLFEGEGTGAGGEARGRGTPRQPVGTSGSKGPDRPGSAGGAGGERDRGNGPGGQDGTGKPGPGGSPGAGDGGRKGTA